MAQINKNIVTVFGVKGNGDPDSVGTGFCVLPELFVTCGHVVDGCKKCYIESKGEKYPATQVDLPGTGKDIALLRCSKIAGVKPVPFAYKIKSHLLMRYKKNLKAINAKEQPFHSDNFNSFTDDANGFVVCTDVRGGAAEGYSGAPVIYESVGDRFVVGMLYLGGEGFSSTCFYSTDTLKSVLAESHGETLSDDHFKEFCTCVPPCRENVPLDATEKALYENLFDEITRNNAANHLHKTGGHKALNAVIQICNDEVIRKTFSDGILWQDCNNNSPESLVLKITDTLLGGETKYSNEHDARNELIHFCKDKKILVVLENVYDDCFYEKLYKNGEPICTIVAIGIDGFVFKDKPGKGLCDDRSQKEPVPNVDVSEIRDPGGTIATDSKFYIKRPADVAVFNKVKTPRGLVTIKGPRSTGKSSLIERTFKDLKQTDSDLRPVYIEIKTFPEDAFKSTDTIWKEIALRISDYLRIDAWSVKEWNGNRGYDWNFTRFLENFVFDENKSPLLLCLDQVDTVFETPIYTQFFSTIRSFYNRAAGDLFWRNIRWLLCSRSEPSFFIQNLRESPFNVGLQIELNEFSYDEVCDFTRRHGIAPAPDLVKNIIEYTGGKPYLVHSLLYNMKYSPEVKIDFFNSQEIREKLFAEFLETYLEGFQNDAKLAAAMKKVIKEKECKDIKMIHRLKSAGLILCKKQKVLCSCKLFAEYFRGKL